MIRRPYRLRHAVPLIFALFAVPFATLAQNPAGQSRCASLVHTMAYCAGDCESHATDDPLLPERQALALLRSGFAHAIEGETEKALADFTDGLGLLRENDEKASELFNALLLERVRVHQRLGDHAGALADYATLIRRLPEAYSVRRDHAETLARGGALDRAEDALHWVLARQPDDALAHLALARIALARGNARVARDYYRKVLQLLPEGSGVAHMYMCGENEPTLLVNAGLARAEADVGYTNALTALNRRDGRLLRRRDR